MALKVKRRERESVQGLIRRFSLKIRQSGILLEARKKRFKDKPKSDLAKKKAALRKQELKEYYKNKRKLGE